MIFLRISVIFSGRQGLAISQNLNYSQAVKLFKLLLNLELFFGFYAGY
ncbi:hypothetical protein [Microcystis aeruginosa]|uniref:Uncharacterized protein n=1 Tax=Microcystis aeruginosa FD4 TaxID=2686288 RepID=A0A857CYC9_MICAE|nr:hypothetical protein [Microcystis aeruginosa]MDB9423085.1 hypothetical protein [Microcystis aeruginosa CS-563/04]QGZ88352.1 hypothetical protein GQR42_00625 [Microcystis aeruginosa FD4]